MIRINQHKELKLEVVALNNEMKKLVEQIKIYQKRVEDTPKW